MATVYFTNNADSGDGSLRAAISAAANGAGALVVSFGYLHISQTTTTATVLKAPTT